MSPNTTMAKVKIYSTPYCSYCRMAKSFFTEKKVLFDEVDVSVDQAAAEEMIKKTNQMGVPVIEIGEDTVVGFDRATLEKILAKNAGLIETTA